MFKNKHCLLLNGLESICKRGSGLWGFRGWLGRECFVYRVGAGGFHILPTTTSGEVICALLMAPRALLL